MFTLTNHLGVNKSLAHPGTQSVYIRADKRLSPTKIHTQLSPPCGLSPASMRAKYLNC